MAMTNFPLGDPRAVKIFGGLLFEDVGRQSYFEKKFVGVGVDAETPIQRLKHLENESGDTISFDLVMQLRGEGVEGDDVLEGREEDLKYQTDTVVINQLRHGVNAGGAMSRKRTLTDQRLVARKKLSQWWARIFDELYFMYLSGARGDNADYLKNVNYGGFASNPLTAPDAYHWYGQNGKTVGTFSQTSNGLNGDALGIDTIDAVKARAATMGGGSSGIPAMSPCMIDGEERYVFVCHPFQEYALRRNTATGGLLDMLKSVSAAEGQRSPLFSGAELKYNNTYIHVHRGVIRFNDINRNGGNYKGARALFMGRQAAVCAFGSASGSQTFKWHEELADHDNQVKISGSAIFGVKKASFTLPATGTSTDFGVVAVDTTMSDPSGLGI